MKFIYHDNDSFLNRLNPLSTVFAALPFFTLLCFINSIWPPIAFIVLNVFIIFALGKVPLTTFFKLSIPVIILSLSLFVFYLLGARPELTAGSPVLFTIGALNIYQASFMAGVAIALRIYALLLFSFPFVLTTEPSNFIRSLIQNLKIPYRFSYGVLVAFRFVPMMETEFNVIRSAHKVMGISEKKGIQSYFEKIKRYSIPIIVNAIRIGERTALSMDGRAFGAFDERTYFRKMEFKSIDWVYIFSYWSVCTIILLVLYNFGLIGDIGVYYGSLGG
ncbi:energy-coupling factor transporter transmembrane component T family protein [Methanobacterium petrolearium]|uniref:energy-coupling factor transporter transmembrane component T family protein n=1 Tax=Methanobacterium petrolearium TaxID=710190 RepID=UPI001AEA47B9|nr:energy-coupling factor transporter transmembrane component T [Methanobacterium petrolearium]MBP1946231.1 energy-coupling factor transport system permease protein [Methanobacterium petrolearium]